MSVFYAEKRLTYTVLSVMVLTAIPAMNNGTNIQREDTTALRYMHVCHVFTCYIHGSAYYQYCSMVLLCNTLPYCTVLGTFTYSFQ